MFDRLKGEVEEVKADHVIIGTPSFSYKVFISLRTVQQLPELGEDVTLFLHPVFKENDVILYGFDERDDRDIFKDVISVSKVGPKIGMALLSLYDRNELMALIAAGKTKDLTKAVGLGKRGADLIIASLKDKYKAHVVAAPVGEQADDLSETRAQDQAFSDTVNALVSLGYSWEVASEAVTASYKPGLSLEDLIKASLQAMNG